MSSRRFRLFVFLVKIWRGWGCPRLILPVAVRRNRFAAPLCVFSFGMIASFQVSTSILLTQIAPLDQLDGFSPEPAGFAAAAGAAAAGAGSVRGGAAP